MAQSLRSLCPTAEILRCCPLSLGQILPSLSRESDGKVCSYINRRIREVLEEHIEAHRVLEKQRYHRSQGPSYPFLHLRVLPATFSEKFLIATTS